MAKQKPRSEPQLRPGQAAEILGITIETLRRWETDGRLKLSRTAGGQRKVPISEVSRLLAERRRNGGERPVVATSARNRLPGVVVKIEKNRVAATVEVLAGAFRLVSLMTAEAVEEMDLRPGDEVVCVVKATNVIVDRPQGGGRG